MDSPPKAVRELVGKFEDAWHSEPPPEIELFIQQHAHEVAASSPATRRLLALCLVRVDLEFRWKAWGWAQASGAGRLYGLEEYARRVPDLGPPDSWPDELVVAEYEARWRWGDRPSAESFLERFPARLATLSARLSEINAQLDCTPLLAPEPRPLAANGTPVIAGYEIECRLGRGGMGEVWKARQTNLKRVVALKMTLAERPGRIALTRFLAEAAAAAAVEHPNVVRIHEYGENAGHPYMALEFCPGKTLKCRLKVNPGPFTAAATIALMEPITQGVAAAHARGIVHRDLKPGNVLFDAGGVPKVADFGLAKCGDGEVTQEGEGLGTPAYMAPEQVRDARFAGPQADVWALGVMLYELLTGERPFTGTQSEILAKTEKADPVSPRKVVPAVPRDLELICLNCLSKRPDDRYPTAQGLADDLTRWREGWPISVRPAGPMKRAAKWARRNPMPTALFVALIGLVAAVVNSNHQLRRANTAENEQRQAERREEEARRKQQLDATGSAIRLALQRGAAREAIRAFVAAEDAGLSPTPAMRLDKARAHDAIGERDAALAEVARVRNVLPVELQAKADLLEGDLLVGVDDARALELIRQAQVAKLDPADNHYALGLLAETAPAAEKRFSNAVKADPTHVPARAALLLTHFSLGKLDDVIRLGEQSRLIAPEHPAFTMWLAIAYAVKGDRASAEAFLETARLAFGSPERFEAVKAVVVATAELVVLIRAGDEDLARRAAALAKAKPAIDLFAWGQGAQGIDLFALTGRLPQAVRNGLATFAREGCAAVSAESPAAGEWYKRIFPAAAAQKGTFGFTDADGAVAARRVLDSHPEGSLKYLYAFRAFSVGEHISPFPGRADESRKLLIEAGSVAVGAAGTPGLFVNRYSCLDIAMMAYGSIGIRSPDRTEQMEFVRKALDVLHERRRLPEQRFNNPDLYTAAVVLTIKANEFALARLLLDEAEKYGLRSGHHDAQLAQVDHHYKAYGPALAAFERLSEEYLNQPSMRDLMRDKLYAIRDDCRHELKLIAIAPAPRRKLVIAPAPRPKP